MQTWGIPMLHRGPANFTPFMHILWTHSKCSSVCDLTTFSNRGSDRWKISPFWQTVATSLCLIANNIEKNNCVSGSPIRQQPLQEIKLKFENNMSISHRWWEQIHLLLWQSVIWKQKYDFISPLGNHCYHKCVCVCVSACDTVCEKATMGKGEEREREQWMEISLTS